MPIPVTPNPAVPDVPAGASSPQQSSARLALAAGGVGAAVALALGFLAGSAGPPDAVAAMGGAGLLACGAVALRGDRGRGLARVLLVVLALGGGWALRAGADRPAPLSKEQLERSQGWLLVTIEDAARHERDERTETLRIAPAAHVPGNLAGVLTGHHPLQMGWPLGAGRDAPRPRGGPRTLGEHQSALGFECATFGGVGLPSWARGGAEARAGGLADAVRWVASLEGAPRFAHVHLATCSTEDLTAARRRCEALGLAAVVVWLEGAASEVSAPEVSASEVSAPEGESTGRFLTGSGAERRVAVWGVPFEDLPVERPASSLCGAGVAILDLMQLPALGPGSLPAVQFEVGPPGRPHRLLARFTDARQGHLDLAVEVTPLGPDPVRDWRLGGAPQDSLAFRNVVRASWGDSRERRGDAGPGGPGEEELQRMAERELRSLEQLEEWRRQIVGDGDPAAPVR